MHNDKTIKIDLEDYLMYDKLGVLAIEYTTTINHLANIAIHRLIDDIEFFRGLRKGENISTVHPATHPNEQT